MTSGIDYLLSDAGKNCLFVSSLYEDERPLKGTSGFLDWRFRGLLSRFVEKNKIKGKPDELVYLPVHFHKELRHLLLVGLGPKKEIPASKATTNQKFLEKLANVVRELRFNHLVISKSSFPFFPGKTENLPDAFKDIRVEYVS